jgi:hypothetical protein
VSCRRHADAGVVIRVHLRCYGLMVLTLRQVAASVLRAGCDTPIEQLIMSKINRTPRMIRAQLGWRDRGLPLPRLDLNAVVDVKIAVEVLAVGPGRGVHLRRSPAAAPVVGCRLRS